MQKKLIICLFILINIRAMAQKIVQSDWQQRVDYSIDVQLDDKQHVLHGHIAMQYTNNSPYALSEVYMHLWPNGYKNNRTAFGKQMKENREMDFYYSEKDERGYMDSVAFLVNGETVQIEKTEHIDVQKLILTEPIKSGQTVTFSTPFRVKLPRVFSRLGHEEQDYFITQWYPKPAVYDVNGWNPMPYLNMGEFYSEFGRFEVNITLPDNYTVVATGDVSDTAELSDFKAGRGVDVPASSKQLKTVTFTADDVHDFAWFASKRWGYVTKQINVGDKKVLARVVAAEPNIEDLSHIETASTYYSSHVGEYPYSHATVVHGELKAGGGMEYPMITLCDYMDREVIVHEVGHNWFYGILASNERRYPWMDESINSFYEGEAISVGLKKASDINQNIMQMMASDNMLCHKHQAISSSSEELTNENYGISIYGYGAEAFGYLKAYLGDAMFKKCMRAYYDEWKFKHPLPGDMQAVYERVSEEDLSWFFKDFLDSDQRLDYSISESSEGFVLKNVSSIKAPVPVDVTIAGKTNTTWYSVAPGEELLIPAIGDDKSAIIDPKGKTLEMNTANNKPHRKLQLKGFFGKDDPAKNEIYMVPTLGYNIYDKMMWGVGIHNYTLKNKPLQYMVLPMYSFTTKKLNGVASVNYTKPLKGIASFIDVGVGVRRFSFKTKSVLLDQQYSYTKMAPYLTYVLPKKSQRSPVERSWKLQYDFVGMTPQFDIDRGDTLSGSLPFEKNRQFVTLTYLKENKRAINGYSLRLMAEYGMSNIVNVLADFDNPGYYDEDSVRKFFPYLKDEWIKNDMLKLSGVLNYNVDFGLKDKPLEIRLFGSYIAKSMGNTTYDNNIGSRDKAGYYDYRMDDVLMGRNATEGLFQNQISRNGDFSKFVGPIYTNQTWMATANITMPLPGKLPLKPYVEFFMADGLDQRTWVNGKSFLYNAGFELEVVPNRFEIFFNLWQSEEVTNYQDGTAGGLNYPFTVSSFAERITFVLDLQNLRPDKLKRSMSFF